MAAGTSLITTCGAVRSHRWLVLLTGVVPGHGVHRPWRYPSSARRLAMNGGVFKRCGCRHPQTGRSMDTTCPRLPERGHGSSYFDCAVATVRGRRERVRRGGYVTRRDAAAARDALLNHADEDRGVEAWTVGRWLRD